MPAPHRRTPQRLAQDRSASSVIDTVEVCGGPTRALVVMALSGGRISIGLETSDDEIAAFELAPAEAKAVKARFTAAVDAMLAKALAGGAS